MAMKNLSKNLIHNFLYKAGITIGGTMPYDIQIHDERVYKEVQQKGSLGAGETYMKGWWSSNQLDEFFNRLMRYELDSAFESKVCLALSNLKNSFLNLQTKVRSLKVAKEHYNLGNDLYEKMLGKTMAYTCGYWKGAKDLDEAQNNKYDLICRKIALKKGERILELGCGWGGFAKYAAEKYGCQVVAANISTEQVNYAKQWCQNLPIEFYLCDYRDSHIYNPNQIKFDKVVSIGLCEHVGPKNYKTLMQTAKQNLKEDGLFLLHTIGKYYTSYVTDPWITKYIFPNSLIPSLTLLANASENLFVIEDLHNFGTYYDKTLIAWHKNLLANWDELKSQYDERFYRLWNYYLLSCAGAFRSRHLQLWQFVLSPKGIKGGYECVR